MELQQRCTVTEVTRLNEYAFHMVLKAGEMAGAIGPGQFLHIKCGHSRLLRRPISICEWREDLVSIVFEIRGEGTRWLARREPGDTLDVLGPLGRGFRTTGEGRYLLVGGGIGLPPVVGCAGRGRNCGRNNVAVVGVRSADRTMPVLLDKLRGDCEEVLLYSDDGSVGEKGFVDAGVREVLARDRDFTAVLACGPGPMLRAVALAAAEYGVPCQVSLEERMACGVGACLGCAVALADGRMGHVCKDGPVFDAGEVDWNA